jgi:transposase
MLRGIIGRLSDQLAQAERERAEQSLRLEQQSNTLQQQTRRIDQLLEYIELLRRKRFGRSADRIPDSQLGLFDETELEALIAELEAELPADTPPPATSAEDTVAPPKGKPVRRPLPSHLPRVERILDLPEAEKAAMGEDWVLIGYDSSEQLAVIPRQTYVIEYKRAKYVARDEDVPGAEVGVKIAPRPAQIIPKSIAHSSLLACIVTSKFVDALPLYRQEKIFAREGIALGRQTMAGLLIQLQTPLQPVAAALQDLLRRGPVVHVDETPVQVLREPGRENTQDSYMWVFCGGPPGNRCAGSNMPRAEPRRFPVGCCSRPTSIRRRCRCICNPTATAPMVSSPVRPGSSATPDVGRTCGASSSMPPTGATPVPRSRWWP